jgi:hypothetical protein
MVVLFPLQGSIFVVAKNVELARRQHFFHGYAILIIAEVLVTAGNCTVNVLFDVLSEPKSSTQMAGFVAPSAK